MVKKYTPKKLGLEEIYNDEYFIPMKSYKEFQNDYNEIENVYLISNYARVYSKKSNRLIKFKNYMVTINLAEISDSLSILRLMMYNFGDKDKIDYLYVIDHSKPITLDNLTTVSSLRNTLTDEQKKLIEEELRKRKTVANIIRDNNLPVNATRNYIRNTPHLPRIKKSVSGLTKDKELSSKLESAILNITNEKVNEYKTLTSLFRDICKSLGIEYNSNVYRSCYRFFYGYTSRINIYKESSTTSRKT